MRLLGLFCLSFSAAFGQTYAISTFAGGGPPDNIPGTSAALNGAIGVAVEPNHNLVIATSDSVFRLNVTTGILSRILATGANAVAVDSSGNLYIVVNQGHEVQKISNGIVTTVAGTGPLGLAPENGPAVGAYLVSARAIAVDAAGNLYIADAGYQRIRKVSNSVITTIAGNAACQPGISACNPGFSGDNGPATNAQLNLPTGVAVDGAGNVYVADSGNGRVRQISNGVITTIAGGGTEFGDGSPATSKLLFPSTVAVDAAGNLLVAERDKYRVRKISDGEVTTLAGTGTLGFSGDNGPATAAQLSNVLAVTADSAGNLYIGDDVRVRRVTNGMITTVAGNGALTASGDGGPADVAQLNQPLGVTVDSTGSVFIADTNNNRIRKVSNGVISTAAGDDNDSLLMPQRVVADSAGNVYVYTTFTDVLTGGRSSILELSNGAVKFVGIGCAPFDCLFHGIAVDSTGAVYVSDSKPVTCVHFGCMQGHSFVRKLSNGVTTTIAGNGQFGTGGNGGPATSAQLAGPAGLAVDSMGDVYIADLYSIREVSHGIISAVTGNSTSGDFAGDGVSAASALGTFSDLAVDAMGNLYTVGNNRVRKISNGVITTIAGDGIADFTGDGGPARNARLNKPSGIAVDSAGRVYIADTGNNRIRVLTPVVSAPGADLTVTSAHTGSITQGQFGATYTIAVSNSGADPTNGPVTVAEISPMGLTVTGMAGVGWNCIAPAGPCTRSDALGASSNYPPITVTVNVGKNAAANVVNTATVAGGGETNTGNDAGTDPTAVVQKLTISSITAVAGISGNQTVYVNGGGLQNAASVMFLGPGNQIVSGTQLTVLSVNQLSVQVDVRGLTGNWAIEVVDSASHESNFGFTVTSVVPSSYALPQFVFGANWYTAIYFANTTNAPASIAVNFIADDGTPLNVPLAGMGTFTTYSAIVNPRSTIILEALNNTGSAGQGWVETTLPPGVIGHAVFRQVVPGRADQEAVVPLTPESSSVASMTYDDTQFTTSVAFLNPSNQAVTAVITALRSDGSQAGSAQVPLAPRSKVTSVLRDLPGLSGILGQRGRVTFGVPGGSGVSVLGLRFGGSAFTSIPAMHGAGPPGFLSTTYALPQFVFGDNWYTALYFSSNVANVRVGVPVSFIDDDGSPMQARLSGIGASVFQTLTLDFLGTGILEAPSGGSSNEGWAEVTLPPDINGYAVFRQVIPGRFNQEALVPLTSEANLNADLIYDDVQFSTCVALLNPGEQPTTVTVTAYTANGAQIGSSQVALGARSKIATVLRTLPGLDGMVGNRGWVSFSVPSGNISVLGLRFGAEAFTSIPVTSR